MAVVVRIPTILRMYTDGESTVEATGATIKDVFIDMEARHPGIGERLIDIDGDLHRFVNVFLGDDDVRYLEGLETPVPDDAEIMIIPAVSGG
ncbi:MAG: molybdopterin synthase sulfur carrier subunit [Gammaproteobacteria bacterium]|nr:molybdopterin synthase sulfur carrier subunit [Gammaproteobacteria bacterium]